MAHWLRASMSARGEAIAVASTDGEWSYSELLHRADAWEPVLASVPPAAVVAFDGDYGPGTISLLLALTWRGNVAVPLSRDVAAHHEDFASTAQAEFWITSTESEPRVRSTGFRAEHPFYGVLQERKAPGLVLFSSGSTGAHKAAVHDLSRLLDKFKTERPRLTTLVFLQLDHIGGINTLFHTLANGGTAVVAESRSAEAVCRAIARHQVELLPTSPTFLNLLLLSEETRRHDLSSLKVITYGTEPMPESTLRRTAAAFPGASLRQTYGLSELGILRCQSRSADSLWVRVGGEGYETKIVDGRLWIRAHSAMLGYLNAPSPFDADGFFDTGDLVDADGDWIRLRGRQSEIINVGGSKVYPAEVESVLLDLDNVADVTVTGERHPITGHIVVATVRLRAPEPLDSFKARLREHCRHRLSAYKIPARIRFTEADLYSARFKRSRAQAHAGR
ncbi:MAG: fatty acid--CoA ligase family protein [Acidobacteriota bacterium]|nr:fatty acid--CoA ligase family protein [Acidobacteriota bacterium]